MTKRDLSSLYRDPAGRVELGFISPVGEINEDEINSLLTGGKYVNEPNYTGMFTCNPSPGYPGPGYPGGGKGPVCCQDMPWYIDLFKQFK
jgi:hypothetical protein